MRSAISQTVRQRVVLSVEFIAGDFTESNSNTVFRISHSCEVVTDEEANDVAVWWLEEDEDRESMMQTPTRNPPPDSGDRLLRIMVA
jgi:hypothetical protein